MESNLYGDYFLILSTLTLLATICGQTIFYKVVSYSLSKVKLGLQNICFLFFVFLHLYWIITALRWCVSFCFITK